MITDLVISNGQLGYFTETSQLSISSSALVAVKCDTGFRISDSSVVIINSRFSRCFFTLFEGKTSNVTITQSQFSNGGSNQRGISHKGGILFCKNCRLVTINSIRVTSMAAPEGGGAIALESSSLSLQNSKFELCSADTGGALLLIKTAYNINYTNFTNCSSEKTGGALDIRDLSEDSVIAHSYFYRNTAKKEGGAVKFHNKVGAFIRVLFEENAAYYGPDMASYGVAVRISPSFPLNFTFVSGNFLPLELNIEILDHFDQIVLSDSTSELQTSPKSTVTYRGSDSTISNNGVFHLQNSPFYATPGTTQLLSLSINLPLSSILFQVNMHFRPCELGEITRQNECVVCAAGTYSLHSNDTECQLCPAHVQCLGKGSFEPSEGYWRSSTEAVLVHACPYRDVCEGGLNSTCSEGYTGKMCMECAENYYRVGTLYCEKCSIPSAVFQVLAYIAQLSLVFFIIFRCLEGDELVSEHKAAVVCIWIEHCQYLIVLLHLKVQLPFLFYYSLRPLQYLGSLSVSSLPITCFYPFNPSIYVKTAIQYLIPFLMLLPSLWSVLKAPNRTAPWKGLISQWRLKSCVLGPAMTESFTSLLISFQHENSHW